MLDYINILINTSSLMYDNYLDLIEMERNGNFNSNNFKTKVTIIRQNIIIFNSILDKLTDNYENTIELYNYLINIDRFKNLREAKTDLSVTFCIEFDNKDEVIFAYIKNKIYQKLLLDINYLRESITNNYEDMTEEEKNILFFQSEYQYYIINDINMLILTMLKQARNTSTIPRIKEGITKMKYSYGFVLPYLQDYLVSKNFKIDSSPYILHHGLQYIYNLNEDDFLQSKINIILIILNEHLKLLKLFKDKSLNNYQNQLLAIDIEITIRSCLATSDDETRITINNLIKEIIKLFSKSSEYQKITKMLSNIVLKSNQDLSLVRIVSFKNE